MIFDNIYIQNISLLEATYSLIFTIGIGIYIFFCYKFLTRKTFYSKNFNISLIAIATITCAIILAVQSSVVISLGMVGALSIVRFRTAIKDPMDLAFLFWSISIGIICGANLPFLAIILSLLLTIVVMTFDRLPTSKASQILIINGTVCDEIYNKIEPILKANTKSFNEKSRSITNQQLDVVYEIRSDKGIVLTKSLSELGCVHSVSLLHHDGEVTF
ncbi:MAG: DUF4956 domain-containing protein [bacterium]